MLVYQRVPSDALEEYMNVDNREYVFRVLNDVTKLPFLAEAGDGRRGSKTLKANLGQVSMLFIQDIKGVKKFGG